MNRPNTKNAPARQLLLRKMRENAQTAGKLVTDAVLVIDKHENKDIVLDGDFLDGKTVVKIGQSSNCVFELPNLPLAQRLTKLFVTECSDCTFNIHHSLVTQHLEVSHCENVVFNINAPLLTLQVDLCRSLVAQYAQNVFGEDTRIIHAGVSNLNVKTFEGQDHFADYEEYFSEKEKNKNKNKNKNKEITKTSTEEEEEEAEIEEEEEKAEAEEEEVGNVAFEELQFMTSLVNGELQTRRIVKRQGHLIPTLI